MIRDPNILRDVQAEWNTVRSAWNMVQTNIVFSFTGGGYTSKEFRSAAYSLTILFAFPALEHSLQQLRDEGLLACKSSSLGHLMQASKNKLPWVNYPLIDEARVRRNRIAHQQEWIPVTDCKRYIDAIEAELRHWSIVV